MPEIGEIKTGKNYQKFIWSACEICGKERWVMLRFGQPRNIRCIHCVDKTLMPLGRKFQKGHSEPRGEKHPHWKGGRTILDGYVYLYLSPDDFFFPMVCKRGSYGGYVREHRLVVAKALGRCLQPWEIVHHKNGIRKDNRYPENLGLTTRGSHTIEHSKGYRDGYTKGLQDGRDKQIEELKVEIKLLHWQLKERDNANIK